MIKIKIDLRGLVHLGNLSRGYFITTIINQALPFLILPVLTRYLPPAEYGNLALFSFYLALSNALTGVSIPTVISKNFFDSDKEYIAKIIGNSVIVVAGLSILTMLLILVSYPFLNKYFEIPLLWLMLIPPGSFAFIVLSMGLNVMRNKKEVFIFGKHQIGNTAINLFISLFLVVVLLWGWQGRALGIIISYFISAIISFYYLNKNGFISYGISKKHINFILKIVLPLIPNSLQMVIISQVGLFFIQFYFTKDLLGVYSIGFQIAIMVKLLIDTLNLSWSPYLYEQLSKWQSVNKMYLTRLFYSLALILFIGVLFINLSSGLLLKIMTTPDFYGAREFIPWISSGYLFYGIYVFLFPVLIKNEKQKFISRVTFLNMFVMIVLNIWFVKVFGHIGVAYAFCATFFMMFAAFFWQVQKLISLPWLKALKIWNREDD